MEYGPPPLFRQGISARARFLFFVLICVILILVDGRLRSLDNFRSAVISFTTPMVHVATLPITLLGEGEGYFISKVKLKTANDQLLEENQKLCSKSRVSVKCARRTSAFDSSSTPFPARQTAWSRAKCSAASPTSSRAACRSTSVRRAASCRACPSSAPSAFSARSRAWPPPSPRSPSSPTTASALPS